MIIFDCECLRSRYNGFYFYALNLAKALLAESESRKEKLGIYALKELQNLFPEGTQFRNFHHVDKHFMALSHGVRLYHVSNQFTRYSPRSFRLPVLTTVHDLNFLHLNVSEEQKNRWKRRTERAVKNATRIATISEFSKKDIVEFFDLDPSRVDVVYNGTIQYNGPICRPDNAPEGDFIFYIGRVTESKNVHVIPPLLEGNDLKLVVCGSVDRIDVEKTRTIEEARRWKCEDRLIFTGPLDDAQKHWYLKNCKAFVFPSLAEGFGLPILEAMQYYKPVFCSDRTSIPEVGGDCVFYFNHEFEPRAMQEEFNAGLDAFASGAIPPEKMAERVSRFSWQRAASEYYDIYERMLL